MLFPARFPGVTLLSLAVCCLLTVAAASTLAQCPDTGTMVFNQVNSIAGSPFQAKQVTTIVTYADDGSKTTSIVKANLFRDSKGRVRVERFINVPDNSSDTATDILLYDHCGNSYSLRPSLHTGRWQTFTPAANAPHQPYCRDPNPHLVINPGPTRTFEDLGSKLIDGVSAHGTRTTEYASASDKSTGGPPTHIYEHWCAKSLDNLVQSYSLTDNPKREVTIAITEIKLDEPDASLFTVPEGYKLTKIDQYGRPIE